MVKDLELTLQPEKGAAGLFLSCLVYFVHPLLVLLLVDEDQNPRNMLQTRPELPLTDAFILCLLFCSLPLISRPLKATFLPQTFF